MARFVTHFESAIDGTRLPATRVQTMHANRPLWTRYDLDQIKQELSKEKLSDRPPSMWRYRELLPVGDEIAAVTLCESMSPLIECPAFAKQLGLRHVWIKDESRLPTGSFKARGIAMAVTMARYFGIERIALASNGNAGGATAMYTARAGLEAIVVMPRSSPIVNMTECIDAGGRLFVADDLIDRCGALVRQGHDRKLWFDISTMKEPYRLEGKKTMGLELAEQMDWELPDVIIYPTGGGTGLIAMWKAFCELRSIGFLNSATMPRMIAVQSNTCMPIVRAFDSGARFAERHEQAHSAAFGICVPYSIGDFMILDTVRESGGSAIAVEESSLPSWQRRFTTAEGLNICPETAACVGALEQLTQRGLVAATDRVVVFNTAASQKYDAQQELDAPIIDLSQPPDWKRFE